MMLVEDKSMIGRNDKDENNVFGSNTGITALLRKNIFLIHHKNLEVLLKQMQTVTTFL